MTFTENLQLFLLQSPAARDSLGGKETADMLVQGASMTILFVTLAGWYVAWRLFSIESRGKKYYLINAVIAVVYLPFLVIHFFKCYDADFQTGTEHYLMVFFLHAVILVIWSLGYYGRHRTEETY